MHCLARKVAVAKRILQQYGRRGNVRRYAATRRKLSEGLFSGQERQVKNRDRERGKHSERFERGRCPHPHHIPSVMATAAKTRTSFQLTSAAAMGSRHGKRWGAREARCWQCPKSRYHTAIAVVARYQERHTSQTAFIRACLAIEIAPVPTFWDCLKSATW